MKAYFLDLFRGAVSLLDGMLVTLQALFSPVVTEQYPRQTASLSPRFRGSLQLVQDDQGQLLCTACGACARTCPSRCLTVQGEKPAGASRKFPTTFRYDISRCSFCGTCVMICPFSALSFTPVRTRVATSREDFLLELCPAAEKPSEMWVRHTHHP
jgi:NADH-quinone oxidoreductase subunit I